MCSTWGSASLGRREYGGRALRNAFFDRWVGREDELAADDVAAAELGAARKQGDFDVAYVYAGQGVALLGADRAAAEVLGEFAGAERLLEQAARQCRNDASAGE